MSCVSRDVKQERAWNTEGIFYSQGKRNGGTSSWRVERMWNTVEEFFECKVRRFLFAVAAVEVWVFSFYYAG